MMLSSSRSFSSLLKRAPSMGFSSNISLCHDGDPIKNPQMSRKQLYTLSLLRKRDIDYLGSILDPEKEISEKVPGGFQLRSLLLLFYSLTQDVSGCEAGIEVKTAQMQGFPLLFATCSLKNYRLLFPAGNTC